MRLFLVCFLIAFTSVAAFSQQLRVNMPPRVDGNRPLRPVHTYSIVARDPNTGELGVAVQSHWFSVGSSVPWVEQGLAP